MRWPRIIASCVVVYLAGGVVADAQEIPPPRVFVPIPPAPNPASGPGAATQPIDGSAAPSVPPPAAIAASDAVDQPPQPTGTSFPPPTGNVAGFEAELGPGEALGVTGPQPTTPGYGLESESLPAQLSEDFYRPSPSRGWVRPRWRTSGS